MKLENGCMPGGNTLTFDQAVSLSHNRSAIYRKGHSTRFWKNTETPLKSRVPAVDQAEDDWLEYDPRDEDSCSLFMFND